MGAADHNVRCRDNDFLASLVSLVRPEDAKNRQESAKQKDQRVQV